MFSRRPPRTAKKAAPTLEWEWAGISAGLFRLAAATCLCQVFFFCVFRMAPFAICQAIFTQIGSPTGEGQLSWLP
jgi:hypothetical protein